jgi:hypothetical protein
MALWNIEHDVISVGWISFCDDQHSQIMLRWRFLALEFPLTQPIFDLSLATREILPKKMCSDFATRLVLSQVHLSNGPLPCLPYLSWMTWSLRAGHIV